eukprot:jgi/Botrbrau1/16900/Bobra.55_3s0001.2
MARIFKRCIEGGEAVGVFRSIVGGEFASECLLRLMELVGDSRTVVTVRCGAKGAIGAIRIGGVVLAWTIPAVPLDHVVDPTGCGNAFCGAFASAYRVGPWNSEACLISPRSFPSFL